LKKEKKRTRKISKRESDREIGERREGGLTDHGERGKAIGGSFRGGRTKS